MDYLDLLQLVKHFIPLLLVVEDLLAGLIKSLCELLPRVQVLDHKLFKSDPVILVDVDHVENLLAEVGIEDDGLAINTSAAPFLLNVRMPS